MPTIYNEADLTPEQLQHIAARLKNGALCFWPTETIPGLFLDPENLEAVEKIYQLKGRDQGKKLGYYVTSKEEIAVCCGFPPPHLDALTKAFLPGPLTLIYNAPTAAEPGRTLGFRFAERTSLLQLIRIFGRPLAGTSANLSGHPPTQTLADFQKQMGERMTDVDIQVDGSTGQGTASTVALIKEQEIKILREGPISLEQIKAVCSVF